VSPSARRWADATAAAGEVGGFAVDDAAAVYDVAG
jgi:hypothetical protein